MSTATRCCRWKQYNYPSSINNCGGPNGISDAFKPLTSLGSTNDVYESVYRSAALSSRATPPPIHVESAPDAFSSIPCPSAASLCRACDVFDTKYPAMVAAVAQRLNAMTNFTGHVTFITSPPGYAGCACMYLRHSPGCTS